MKKLKDYMVTRQALKEELANFKGKSGNQNKEADKKQGYWKSNLDNGKPDMQNYRIKIAITNNKQHKYQGSNK